MLRVINDNQGLSEVIEYLEDKDFVAWDTETTGLSKYHEVIGISVCASEDIAFYIVLAKWNKELQKLEYSNYANTINLLTRLRSKKLIAHNAVFDCKMINSNFKIDLMPSIHTDTMILAHLLNENRKVGLKELANSMYGETSTVEQSEMKASVLENGGKLTKSHYELYKADAQLIGKYGAKDALLTFKLFTDLIPELYEQNLDGFFFEESMPLLRGPTYDLNTTGLMVDNTKLIALKKTLEAECAEAKAYIKHEIQNYVKDKPKFNVEAPQQLSWLLFGEMSLDFKSLTKVGKEVAKSITGKIPYYPKARRDFIDICLRDVGKPYKPGGIVNGKIIKPKLIKPPWAYIQVDKSTLAEYSERFKWIEKLLQYKKKMKLLTTYIAALEEKTKYGVIQPSFLQHGTSSGRYASREPNFQNLPRDDQRIKECIVARPGKVFVSADYSQLEPRVFSYYSQDARLMAAFDGHTDFYSVIGIVIFNKHDALPIKDGHPDAFGTKYKALRDRTKTIALARAYGASAAQLAPAVGKSIEETQQDLENLDEEFPGIKKMMLEAHEAAKTQGFVSSLFGRKRRMPDALKIKKIYGNQPHSELPYEARSLLNLACNHRIQSTGASLVNRAMIQFYNNIKELNIDCKIVSQIHDEIVVECNEQDAQTVEIILQNAMETTNTLPGVPLEAIPRISKSFAK